MEWGGRVHCLEVQTSCRRGLEELTGHEREASLQRGRRFTLRATSHNWRNVSLRSFVHRTKGPSLETILAARGRYR